MGLFATAGQKPCDVWSSRRIDTQSPHSGSADYFGASWQRVDSAIQAVVGPVGGWTSSSSTSIASLLGDLGLDICVSRGAHPGAIGYDFLLQVFLLVAVCAEQTCASSAAPEDALPAAGSRRR